MARCISSTHTSSMSLLREALSLRQQCAPDPIIQQRLFRSWAPRNLVLHGPQPLQGNESASSGFLTAGHRNEQLARRVHPGRRGQAGAERPQLRGIAAHAEQRRRGRQPALTRPAGQPAQGLAQFPAGHSVTGGCGRRLDGCLAQPCAAKWRHRPRLWQPRRWASTSC